MKKHFVICFQGSQGSSAIQELLCQHPDIRFVGFEPFDRYRFNEDPHRVAGNPMSLAARANCFSLFFSGDDAALRAAYAQHTTLPLATNPAKVQGFKFRFSEEVRCEAAAKDVFLELFERHNVHLFFLSRKNILLQALSWYRGVDLQFRLAKGEVDADQARRRIHVDLDQFAAMLDSVKEHNRLRRELFSCSQSRNPGHSTMIYYEDFLYRKRDFLHAALGALGCDHQASVVDAMMGAATRFHKVHADRVEEIVQDPGTIAAAFPREMELCRRVQQAYRAAAERLGSGQ